VTIDAILVHSGLGSSGGVTTDVRNLEQGLSERQLTVALAGNLGSLFSLLRRHRRALVHVFGCLPSPTTFGAIAAAKAWRRPLVWTPVFHPSRRNSWVGYGVLRAMELFDAFAPRAARVTDAVVAATPAEAEFFAALGARRVELIPPGVPPPPHDASAPDAARERLHLDPTPVVLTVARDNSRKGLPFGLAAFDRVRDLVPDAQLLLVGPQRDHPAARITGVRCPGWLTPEDVELAFRTADVVFVPSLYEGLPRAVIEAWRFARAVVATDRVALAPTIEEGGAGRVVAYGNVDDAAAAIAEILGDPALARRYGNRGRQIVRDGFLLERVVEETQALYRGLLRTASGGREKCVPPDPTAARGVADMRAGQSSNELIAN
jgi:glycosyltransferase involved in cell wall biosynthesis